MADTHSEAVAYVRRSAIPEQAPPRREQGVARWVRVNLFSNWFYGALTILCLVVLYWILSNFLPWLLGGIWNASSLTECREILSGGVGGCFAVLTERWNQLIFGFAYPTNLYWRPMTAFVLLFVAAAPVLFPAAPRRMLYFTALYPFVAFWLIWGGTMLTPLSVILAIVAAYYAFSFLADRSFAGAVAAGIVAFLVVLNLVGWVAAENPRILRLDAVQSRSMGGFMLNLILGTVCISLSLPFGIMLALGRQSRLPIIKGACIMFIEFIRGVPLITLLFVANVVLAYFLPPSSNFDLILRVIIMITMFASAYIAEVIRGGLAALPRGQYEGADAMGLTYWQSMRLVILPQALKISIPGIVNVAVGLFKDTTLVSIISMFDLVGMIRGPILSSTDWNGVYWELYGFAALLFFVTCFTISQYSQWLERQLTTDRG